MGAAVPGSTTCKACLNGGNYWCKGPVSTAACYSATGDKGANCAATDGNGNTDYWADTLEKCVPGNSCANLGGDEGCSECTPFSDYGCGWCFSSGTCQKFTGTAAAPTGMSCPLANFNAQSCIAPCVSRQGCETCLTSPFLSGSCAYDDANDACADAPGASGSFTTVDQCPQPAAAGRNEAFGAAVVAGAALCAL
jgi:hypothetical protein